MKKNIVLLSLLILGINNVKAQLLELELMSRISNSSKVQELNNMSLSPDVYNFQLTNIIPMNLSTGRLDLSIPIYEIKVDEITVPISIRYNSNGIKVNEVSGNIGANWSLNAGGSVIREIRDVEDHRYTTELLTGTRSSKPYVQGIVVSSIGKLLDSKELDHLEYKEILSTDAQSDLFIVNAPGISTNFIISKNEGSSPEYIANEISLNNSIVNILGHDYFDTSSYIQNTYFGDEILFPSGKEYYKWYNYLKANDYEYLKKRYAKDYIGFHIINNKGVEYKFNTYDVNTNASSILTKPLYNSDNNVPILQTAHFFQNNFSIKKGAWFLDEIISTNRNKIKFKYKHGLTDELFEKTRSIGSARTFDLNGNLDSSESLNTSSKSHMYTQNTLSNDIEEIIWDKGRILFIYDTNKRKDYISKNALKEIVVKNFNDETIEKYIFNYSYYLSEYILSQKPLFFPPTDLRLRLDEIQKVDNNNKLIYKHSFKYNSNMFPASNTSNSVLDIFGFYRKQKDGQGYKTINFPNTYYRKGQGRFSFIPFPVEGYEKVFGDFDATVYNDDAGIGLLSEYITPTGAIQKFNYEANSFKFYNTEILGGGVRIASQEIIEENKPVRKISYDYSDDNFSTSGYISSLPNFSNITIERTPYLKEEYGKFKALSTNLINTKLELLNGSTVSYKKVVEKEEENGSTEYKFISEEDYPDNYATSDNYNDITLNMLTKNSPFIDLFTDNSLLRDNIYKSKIKRDNDNKMVFEEIINYSRFLKKKSNKFNRGSLISSQGNTFVLVKQFSLEEDYRKLVPIKKITNEYNNLGVVSTVNKLDYNGVNINFEDIKPNYEINLERNLDKTSLKSTIFFDSKGGTISTEYQYPPDWVGNMMADKLTAQNRISEPLTIVQKNNGIVVSAVYNEYNEFNGIIQKSRVFQKKGSDQFIEGDDIIIYNSYDGRGNLTQYTLENGIPVSIIWGYKGQYPIAKIEGSTNTELNNYIQLVEGNIQSNNDTYKLIFEKIREDFPNSMITTYLYKPLIGITSITAPNGQTEYYNYDAANRLQSILNDKNEVLKTFEYNYKN